MIMDSEVQGNVDLIFNAYRFSAPRFLSVNR